MASIIAEKLISFKVLEEKTFEFVCMLAVEITKILLEAYDDDLKGTRDKAKYKIKDKVQTTVKTVYGSVSYKRRYYETVDEEGRKKYVYLLDEAMKMEKVELMSSNLAEKIAMIVTESPYRVAAETINATCGQSISHGGIWHFMQRLGELSAGKTPKKDGKGNPYVDVINRHMPIIDAMQTASRKAFKRAFG